jgi:hypothetical protein
MNESSGKSRLRRNSKLAMGYLLILPAIVGIMFTYSQYRNKLTDRYAILGASATNWQVAEVSENGELVLSNSKSEKYYYPFSSYYSKLRGNASSCDQAELFGLAQGLIGTELIADENAISEAGAQSLKNIALSSSNITLVGEIDKTCLRS